MNRNFIKIGALVILLVVPILIYIFLRSFGSNHYSLPKFIPIEFKEINENGKLRVDTLFHVVPKFNLINSVSDSINDNRFEGKILICNFFFTRCPGICPRIMANLTRAQEAFIDSKDVNMVSISVDPDYDRPEILKGYEKKFNTKHQKWVLSTGTEDEVYKLGFYGFKLPADTIDHTLHSEKVVLLDKDRHIRGYYTGTDSEEINRLILETKILQYEYEHSK